MNPSKTPFARTIGLSLSFAGTILVGFVLRWWTPLPVAIAFILGSPFLLFVPGYFLTKIIYPMLDGLETATLSVALSLIVINLPLFIIEQVTEKLMPLHVALHIVLINALCAGIYHICGSKNAASNKKH